MTSFSAQAFTPHTLWQAWPEARFVNTAAPCLRHDELLQSLQDLATRYPDRIQLEEIGKSFLGRPVQLLRLGSGEKNILLWSQMHGDEPSATPALLDIANYLLANSGDPLARSILESYTLLMIPMLNPDGTEVYQRRNAQGIDINRDALQLASPEGRILKRIRDEHEPMLGFNLHDQDRRIAVGDTGQVANIAVLSVSGDAENTLTLGRLRTKRANAAIVEALAPYIPGGIARYDEEWSARAFGDSITAWGTPVILIESGGFPNGDGVRELTRLNFVAILAVLKGLTEDDLAAFDVQVYEDLPHNQNNSWSDVVVRGAYVLQPGTHQAFRADLAFDVLRNDQQAAGCTQQARIPSRIALLGDASFHGAGTNIDATGSLLLTPFDAGVKGWSQRQWLDDKNLLRLAQLGVGKIYWVVGEADVEAARTNARKFAMQGMPRIEVTANSKSLPALVLSGPPALPGSSSLDAILRALGVENPKEAIETGRLWLKKIEGTKGSARLRKYRPASFLVVSSGGEGQVDPRANRLISVWLDGQQVTLESASGQ